MTGDAERLPDIEIGERLRLAREVAKLTQEEAAATIDAARTTIVAIEQGKRRVRIDELQKLAALYGTSANTILRREAVHLDMVPRFRKLPNSGDKEVESATHLLNDLVRAELELENALGATRARSYPPERPILPGNVKEQAELDAQELREWLGLGPGPVVDLVSLLDLQLGIRVYVRRLGATVSGLYAYDEVAGACILLNQSHPEERLVYTAAHECGHFISTRKEAEVVTNEAKPKSREERYADTFARCFLTPSRALRQRFSQITAGQSHLTRRHVILLAHAFGVSREAMVRRLEELSLAKEGTWDWFVANGGITDDQARQVVGETSDRSLNRVRAHGHVPPRLGLLAREAWKRELYSEGQLARLLRLNRHEIREVLDGAEMEESEANELVKLHG